MDSFRIDAFTTKIGLSSGAVIGLSSLRDELPEFRGIGNDRIGFNLNASRNAWVTAVGVERIQDKTRWTKALGVKQ